MQRKAGIIILSAIGICISYYAEAQVSGPREPKAPEPPVVQGANQNRKPNEFPSPPPIPKRDAQNNEAVKIVDSYELDIVGAYPNGNTSNNTANTINNAQYVLYSNGKIEIRLNFTNGTEYVYHLRNPKAKVEINPGLYRETFDTLVQVGKQFLLSQYTGELSYNENTITSFNLIENNKVIVLLNIKKK